MGVHFQVGVLGVANLSRFHLEFPELRRELRHEAAAAAAAAAAGSVPASAFTCSNLGGVDYHGRRFDRTADYRVPSGAVGSLWVGVDLPTSLGAGTYRGTLLLTAHSGGGGSGGGGGTGAGDSGTYAVALSLALEVSPLPFPPRPPASPHTHTA